MVKQSNIKCTFAYLGQRQKLTRTNLSWLRGTLIPDEDLNDLVAKAHELEVHDYVLGLLKSTIDSIPASDLLRSLVADRLEIDIHPVISFLASAGFVLSPDIRVSDKDYMPRPSESLYREGTVVFSVNDGLHFTFLKAINNTAVKFIVAFIPKNREPAIHVEMQAGNLTYKIYASDDKNLDHVRRLAMAAISLSNGRITRCSGKIFANKYWLNGSMSRVNTVSF